MKVSESLTNGCDAKFKMKSGLDRHLKSVHRVKEENKSV